MAEQKLPLEPGERLLWRSSGAGSGLRRAHLLLQVAAHLVITALGIYLFVLGYLFRHVLEPRLVLAAQVGGPVTLFLGNAAMAATGIKGRRGLRQTERTVHFLTDRRVGVLRGKLGLSQMPLLPHIEVREGEDSIEFRLPEQVPITLEGLSGGETRLLKAALEHVLHEPDSQENTEGGSRA
ncbi:MAG: hypothetical protein QGI33_00685 [Candidatus Brocadiia bacterium]|jgi:hypothetical protein|nr:hypothetical protein [Candidatus Brocadiia bacterium]